MGRELTGLADSVERRELQARSRGTRAWGPFLALRNPEPADGVRTQWPAVHCRTRWAGRARSPDSGGARGSGLGLQSIPGTSSKPSVQDRSCPQRSAGLAGTAAPPPRARVGASPAPRLQGLRGPAKPWKLLLTAARIEVPPLVGTILAAAGRTNRGSNGGPRGPQAS